MSNKTYDILKYIAQIALPALGTLYFALSQIWGLPYGEQIVGTITAVDAFLGALLKLKSDAYYNDADDCDDEVPVLVEMDLDGDAEEIDIEELENLDEVDIEELEDSDE